MESGGYISVLSESEAGFVFQISAIRGRNLNAGKNKFWTACGQIFTSDFQQLGRVGEIKFERTINGL